MKIDEWLRDDFYFVICERLRDYFHVVILGDLESKVEVDPCLSKPCLNRGECIQLKYGRYKCECTGTNFYGENCQKSKKTFIMPNIIAIHREHRDTEYRM